MADGRPSGEAFVELQSEEDVSKALAHHNEHMGRRYVEMFRASRGQMEWECRLDSKGYGGGEGTGGYHGDGGGSGGVVRLRGLPYGCAEEEVRKFFSGWQRLKCYCCSCLCFRELIWCCLHMSDCRNGG